MNAQENTSDTTIYTNPDKPASYKGGEWAKIKFINKHLVYPQKAKEEKTEGRVKVEMIVEKDGSLSDIKIVRSLSPECDAEIKRVVALMPKWKPAYHQKQAVRSLTSFSVFIFYPTNKIQLYEKQNSWHNRSHARRSNGNCRITIG